MHGARSISRTTGNKSAMILEKKEIKGEKMLARVRRNIPSGNNGRAESREPAPRRASLERNSQLNCSF